jgi:hypothetical protein
MVAHLNLIRDNNSLAEIGTDFVQSNSIKVDQADRVDLDPTASFSERRLEIGQIM